MKKKAANNSGQGVIELLVTVFAFFTLAFMYVQVALSLGVANYFQYVTFMGARAYLSAGADEAEQKKAAMSVLESTLQSRGKDRFSSIARGQGDGDVPGLFVGKSPRVDLGGPDARASAWEQGVKYKFKMRMYMLPLVSGVRRGNAAMLELTSESWLGREPTESECMGLLRQRKQDDQGADFLFDNGC